ncbi:hypothetical protein PCANC_10724 [Puccinia coronata f. sp. avenae]|uniref:Uncharacterized protein n=1 Tax=Puccinia coronata f. sp. avenae TaxID=200324 RepID=A0A2N5VSV3_9BASI|nr:hypothetical protein PCANC_10724 [Puccinia coronata f. sp. avenae]
MDHRYDETSNASLSHKIGNNRKKLAKPSPQFSQLERPSSNPIDPKKMKFLSHHRPSSPPSRSSLLDHGKEQEINDKA